MQFIIREARSEEALQLGKIAIVAKQHWGYPAAWFELWGDIVDVTPQFIEDNYVWVATNEDDILAFIAIGVTEKTAELEHLWVKPEYMQLGIGRQLLRHAIDFCEQQEVTALKIESDPNAQGFYEKLGAKQIGEVQSKPAHRKLPLLVIKIQPSL